MKENLFNLNHDNKNTAQKLTKYLGHHYEHQCLEFIAIKELQTINLII